MPSLVEGGVQRAVAVVAHQGKIRAALAADKELSIRQHKNFVRLVIAGADGRDDIATCSETGVEAAVGIEPQNKEVVIGAVVNLACHHCFAIRLGRDCVGIKRTHTKSRSYFSHSSKRRVHRARLDRASDHGATDGEVKTGLVWVIAGDDHAAAKNPVEAASRRSWKVAVVPPLMLEGAPNTV